MIDTFLKQIKRFICRPMIVFDIGAYNAADLARLCEGLNLSSNNGYAFEPHPGMHRHIENRKVNLLKCAISNYDSDSIVFHAVDLSASTNHGTSSMFEIKRPHDDVSVECHRIDTLIQKGIIPVPDVVKLDVEGGSYEALEGFGDYLKEVKFFHIETEIIEVFPGQHLRKDVESIMSDQFDLIEEIHIPHAQYDLIYANKILTSGEACAY